jgi:hypothetical protein
MRFSLINRLRLRELLAFVNEYVFDLLGVLFIMIFEDLPLIGSRHVPKQLANDDTTAHVPQKKYH